MVTTVPEQCPQSYRLPSWIKPGSAVAVAMSGGVDSTTACTLLQDAGCEVVGLHMQVWSSKQCDSAARSAEELAARLGIKFHLLDLREEFHQRVVTPFVDEYLSGITPNPCVLCNRRFKFARLRECAESLGVSILATGHYVQVKESGEGTFGLFNGKDDRKDQSYFLHTLTQPELAKTLFPLGRYEKPGIREIAWGKGLEFSADEDSQDVCFIDVPVSQFIEGERSLSGTGGLIVDSKGRVLGRHKGVHCYTIGQRRGLGVAAAEPLYVIGLDADEKTVTVGFKDELRCTGLFVQGINWLDGSPPAEPFHALVKLRYRHPGARCDVEPAGDSGARVRFVDEWSAVSPGQSAVFYGEPDDEGDRRVIGGGVIEYGERG